MDTYSFKNIKKLLVVGNCHGDIKAIFKQISDGLCINAEDEEAPHPKEIERQARKRAMNGAFRNHIRQFGDMPIGGVANHVDEFAPVFESLSTYNKLKKLKKVFSDSLLIISGDCGIGFNKPTFYDDYLKRINKILSYNNSYVIMIRGNHDDPSYFDGKRINLSNIIAVPDYTVVNACDKNILCIGGAISLDRTWRIKQEERINRFSTSGNKKFYWKNEAPVFNKEAMEEITKNVKIDFVVSHTAPSFVSPEVCEGIDEWADEDKTIISDIKEERCVMDKVFETLRDCGMKPKYWAYGHFISSFFEKRSDTLFRCVGGITFVDINEDIGQYLAYDEMLKAKKKKTYKKTLKIKSIETDINENIGRLQQPQYEIDAMLANDTINNQNGRDAVEINELYHGEPDEEADEEPEEEVFGADAANANPVIRNNNVWFGDGNYFNIDTANLFNTVTATITTADAVQINNN